MLNKIITLKANTDNKEAKSLCETAIIALSSSIYNNVSNEARYEIETYAIEHLFEKLKTIEDDNIKKWINTEERLYSVKNLGIKKAISKILEKENDNPTLVHILNEWINKVKVNEDFKICESFINAMGAFSFYPTVNSELENIKQKINLYKADIDLSKIVEMMKETNSNYLVPLIENAVYAYISDKNQQTKTAIKYTLEKFAYDPFVRDILNIVNLDATSLQLEYNNDNNDISKIYSPVYYIDEGVAVFNSFGDYYVRKGNTLSRLPKEEVSKLPESFVYLCNILNDERVEITNETVKIYLHKDVAEINENEVRINSTLYDAAKLTESKSMHALMNKKVEIFDVSTFIKENYDSIAEIDFGKRVYNKSNPKQYADVFKIRDNVFITTAEPVLGKKTFYKGINPIEAKTIMKEHMQYDITSVFADILPKYEKTVKKINETKKEYLNYINQLNESIDKFKSFNNEKADLVLRELNEELKSVKNEFREYNIKAENYIRSKKVDEGMTLTIKDDATGETQTVVLPGNNQPQVNQNNQTAMNMTGMSDVNQVGNGIDLQQPMNTNSNTSVTFDDNNSELLGSQPSDPMDSVQPDVNAEEIEKDAEEAEDKKEEISPESNPEQGEVQPTELKGEPEGELENVGDEEEEEKKEEKLFLKKENVTESLHESLQIGDEIKYKTLRGEISGKMLNGDLIVICHPDGKTYQVKESEITAKYPKTSTIKQFKFDKETQKLLFEHNVKCGVYIGNIPIKLKDCKVNYAEWMQAGPDNKINVLVEGRNTLLDKSTVKILEDVNNFANYELYKPCKLLKENSWVDALVNMFDVQTQNPEFGTARTITTGKEEAPEVGEYPISNIDLETEPEDVIVTDETCPMEVEFKIRITNLDSNPEIEIVKDDAIEIEDENPLTTNIEIAKMDEDDDSDEEDKNDNKSSVEVDVEVEDDDDSDEDKDDDSDEESEDK